jgi:hypothetical protein
LSIFKHYFRDICMSFLGTLENFQEREPKRLKWQYDFASFWQFCH